MHAPARPLRVLVLGALGGVGEGIVRALLERREHLAGLGVCSRDAERLAHYHASIDHDPLVVPFTGGVADDAAARVLRDEVRAWGRPDIVIASLGGWWSGAPVTGIDDATWRATMDALLTPHAVCARTFVPELAHAGAKYLLVGGGAALTPVPGSTLVSIAAAAQLMLTRALVAERGTQPPLIAELVIDSAVATNAPHHGPVTAGEVTAADVGTAIAAWCFSGADASFAWPPELLETDGPIAIMRPRSR